MKYFVQKFQTCSQNSITDKFNYIIVVFLAVTDIAKQRSCFAIVEFTKIKQVYQRAGILGGLPCESVTSSSSGIPGLQIHRAI